MLRYLHGRDLGRHPALADTMFRDRADQFGRRLGWPVTIDANGHERDQYDPLDPLYVIWQRPDGSHGGSARFLPTTGRTMVNEHFLHLTQGVALRSPFIWECTRFCLAPGAEGRIATALMLGGAELMRAFALTHFVGVFDAPMLRVYRRIGEAPQVLGQDRPGRQGIGIGLWEYTSAGHDALAARAGITPARSRAWFDAAFDAGPDALALTA